MYVHTSCLPYLSLLIPCFLHDSCLVRLLVYVARMEQMLSLLSTESYFYYYS